VAGHAKRFCLNRAAQHRWAAYRSRPASLKPGSPLGWLTIEDAAISTLVLNGISAKQLGGFPCGEPIGDATLIIAHRDTHFRGLKHVLPGTRIGLDLPEGSHSGYVISDQVIINAKDAEDLIQQYAAPDRLLLLTCYPFRYIGPAPMRVLFIAEPVESRDRRCSQNH
jgi:LPXTG-site transpeptidase (sortase) family protein